MHGQDDRLAVPHDWIRAPTNGALFAGQTLASGKTAPVKATAKRIVVLTAGDLYLIPIGNSALTAGALFGPVVEGQQIDQQCLGLGGSNTAVVTAQFN